MRAARAGRHAVGGGVLALRRPVLLALRALGLGDLLTGVPALRALADAFPEHDRALACPAALAPLLDLADTGFRVVDTRGLDRALPTGPAPDVAVNLHGRGPQSHRRMTALAPGRLVAFANAEVPHDGPSWRRDEHEVVRWCRLLTESLGVLADAARLALRPPVAMGDLVVPGAVVIHPGAAHRARQWPPTRFAAVARLLERDGLPVVVTGSADEVALARRVGRQAGLPPEAVLAGRTDLLALAAQVAAARLVVCGDTGTAHLASAFGTPSVVLFGPTPPSWWGPPPDGPHRALWQGTGVGDPWADGVDPALDAVTVDEVMAAAREVLTVGHDVTRRSATRSPPTLRTTAGSA